MNESEFRPNQETKETKDLLVNLNWEVPSEITGLNTYRDKFEQLLTELNHNKIKSDQIFGLTLGFDEALINAIKYGNKEDPTKMVEVEVAIDQDKLIVKLKDQNPVRFDPEEAFDSVKNESELYANHGRGITLMKELYDSIKFEFKNPGNEVTLTKNLEA